MPGPLYNREALDDMLDELQSLETDHQRVEAKRAGQDIPADLWKAMSAFANTPGQGGGTILLGVDESTGFSVTGIQDVSVLQDKVRSMASGLIPKPDIVLQAHEISDRVILEVFVHEVADLEKPCYWKAAGRSTGSYRRVGDSNERLSDVELAALELAKRPARDDEAPVEGATLEDLDPDLVTTFLEQRRSHQERYRRLSDVEILQRSHVLTRSGDVTLAGLIAMGEDPGYFHPGLKVQFVAWATEQPGAADASGVRYVDNPPMFSGSLPYLFRQIFGRTKANLRSGSRIDTYRTNVPEYPDVVLREALINALVHRDLHPGALNSFVTISVFPDRLEIVNPGGLYQVAVDENGRPRGRSTRNARLMEILEHLPMSRDEGMVVENRGGGVPAIVEEIRRAGLQQPRFSNQIFQLALEFPRGSLVAQETLDWLAREGTQDLTITQRLGAALLHQGEVLTNETYRLATGVDSVVARAELLGLVERGLAESEGQRGGRKDRLSRDHQALSSRGNRPQSPHGGEGNEGNEGDSRRDKIVSMLAKDPEARDKDLARALRVSLATIQRDMRQLREDDRVGPRRPGRRPTPSPEAPEASS